METIFLKNTHFLLFDQWFVKLSEKQQDEILEKTPGIESYCGIELVNETFDEEKGFEFKIVNVDRWNTVRELHDFLQNL